MRTAERLARANQLVCADTEVFPTCSIKTAHTYPGYTLLMIKVIGSHEILANCCSRDHLAHAENTLISDPWVAA
jgi:hypothetical protein